MPNLSRRSFLSRIGIGAAAVAAAMPAIAKPMAYPDRFMCGSHEVWWGGWRLPANQDVKVGFWLAMIPKDDRGRSLVGSTTTGGIYPLHLLGCIDMTFHEGWPVLTSRNTDRECEVVKQRAAVALVEYLHG